MKGHSELAVVVGLASLVISCPGTMGNTLREALGARTDAFDMKKVVNALLK
jgi:hypothetical protein